MNNKRFYNFILVIYEDDERFDKQFFNLSQEMEAIWIRHDQDVFEEDVVKDDEIIHHAGDIKKPHYHFVLKLRNACTISALAKRNELDENMIEPVKKSLNVNLKYLIHFGSDNKYQYDIKDVQSNSTNLKRRLEDMVTKDTPEVEKVISIQEFINEFPDIIKWNVLMKYVQKINKWDTFRRNYQIFRDLVNEHNNDIYTKRFNQNNLEYYEPNHGKYDTMV